MARPARAYQRDGSQTRPAEFDDGEDEDLEHEVDDPREPDGTRSTPRSHGLLLAGGVLIGMLALTIWLLMYRRHDPPSTHVIADLPRAPDAILEASRNTRGARAPSNVGKPMPKGAILTAENDPHDTVGEDSSRVTFQDTELTANHPAQMDPTAEPGGSPEELRILQQRFDRMDISMQALQGAMQAVLTEVRSSGASAQMKQTLESADKMVSLLKKQLTNRDQEIVRLRGALANREHLVNDMKSEAQRASARSTLAGWEIVGLTARNAALKDPSGQTHVVSVGETIVDGVQLKQIDPTRTRITTSAGDIVYHGAR